MFALIPALPRRDSTEMVAADATTRIPKCQWSVPLNFKCASFKRPHTVMYKSRP